MDISTLSSVSPSYAPAKTAGSVEAVEGNPAAKTEQTSDGVNTQQQNAKDKEMTKDDTEKLSADLNKIMQLLNADLQFSVHEKTQRLIVKLVDVKENKVLKEFPPHELLDTLAAIRDYIGLLLDKKV